MDPSAIHLPGIPRQGRADRLRAGPSHRPRMRRLPLLGDSILRCLPGDAAAGGCFCVEWPCASKPHPTYGTATIILNFVRFSCKNELFDQTGRINILCVGSEWDAPGLVRGSRKAGALTWPELLR